MPIPKEKARRFTANLLVGRAAFALAVLSALFCMIVSTLLIANYLQVRAINPLDSLELQTLRAKLAAAPEADAQLVAQIRALDLLARKAFFTSQEHLKLGGQLLLGSTILFLIAFRLAMRFNPRPPMPAGVPSSTSYWSSRAWTKEILALMGVVFVVVALFAAYFTRLDVPDVVAENAVPEATAAPVAAAYPDWETVQQQWPSFRGPGAYGVAHFTTAPTDWDGASGKNIAWKTEVPLPGANSPVVWGKRVFLSGATKETREVYCFDTETGQLLWKKTLEKLAGTPDTPPKVNEETGYAASTMAAHGDRVFAIFANGDLICLNEQGEQQWAKNLGPPDNHYGHSSSLLAYQNLLIIQYDQKRNGKLIALNLADGNEAWTTSRTKISWSSPICVKTAFGDQLVLTSEKNADAYDPLTGKLVWQLACLDGEVAPSAAYGGGMFFVANEYATATAIRFAADSKEPKPEMAWEWDESLPDTSSPVGTDKYFYIATSRGEIICLVNSTGKPAWAQEYNEGFAASPIVVGDRIYAFDRAGTAQIFKVGPTYELIGAPALGEVTLATPAFLDNRVYVRTEKNLICIAEKK